jgi:hypothetical protein
MITASSGRVLLPDSSTHRRIRNRNTGELAYASDYSVIPFLLEEFIALGASEIVIETEETREYLSSVLPPAISKRVILDHYSSFPAVRSAMAPITEELGCEMDQYTISGEADIESVFHVSFGLRQLLLGVEHETEVELDVARVLLSLERLSGICRSGDARSTIAVLRGIFQAYKPCTTVDAAVLNPEIADRSIRLFSEFIEDATYREMSSAAHACGIPRKAKRALELFSRAARSLASTSPFKQMLNLGSKAISTATHVPIPDSDAISSLFKKEYLPPVVDMRIPVLAAMQSWDRLKPSYLPPSNAGLSPFDWEGREP